MFPVLHFPFVEPRHGRVFYAHMEGKTLRIYQSRLDSFEHLPTAPVGLFARWILSEPLETC
jgi:hypothetical protein